MPQLTHLSIAIAFAAGVALPSVAGAQVPCDKPAPYTVLQAAQLPNQTWIVKCSDGSIRKFRGPPEDAEILLPAPPACPQPLPNVCWEEVGSFSTFAVLGDRLFFAWGPGAGTLHETDGTAQGTRQFGLGLGEPLQAPVKQYIYNGSLYFSAYQPGAPFFGFRTDGTWAGTQAILTSEMSQGFILGVVDQGIYWSVAEVGHLIYQSFDGTTRYGWSGDWEFAERKSALLSSGLVFRWNGILKAAAGLVPARFLDTVPSFGSVCDCDMVVFPTQAFILTRSSQGLHLVRTDGSDAGTSIVRTWSDASLPFSFDRPVSPVIANNRVMFAVEFGEPGHSMHVLSYDVTSGQSSDLDLAPFGTYGYLSPMVVGNRLAFFDWQRRLWVTDGTASGTRQLCNAPEPVPWERTIICNHRVFLPTGQLFMPRILNICPADFNNDLAVDVQDIFDFLDAYFDRRSSADVNGRDGPSVQDIFDVLASYFSGC